MKCRVWSIVVILILFFGSLLSFGIDEVEETVGAEALLIDDSIQTFTEKGRVLELMDEVTSNTNSFGMEGESTIQYLEVEITSGKLKGRKVYLENHIDSSFVLNLRLKKGDKVILYITEYEDGTLETYVSDLQRDHILLGLVVLFFLVLLWIGRGKGLKSFLMLFLTGIVIWKFYIPYLLKGIDPILLSVASLTLVTIVTLFFISGWNRKSLVAVIGTLGGLFIAGILALISGKLAQLTGLGNEEAQMLSYISEGIQLNYQGILFSGILIGALGAVMDVGMSVASSTYEIHTLNSEISKYQLFKSGMNVGRDVMGTMSNTLILAYAGGSLPLMLLFQANQIPLIEMLNREMIASEVVRAISGSIGLVLTIPITAFIATILYPGKNKKEEGKQFNEGSEAVLEDPIQK